MATNLSKSLDVALQEGNERMRREINRDEKGVTHVIEFTIALTMFVLIFQAFTSSMNYRIGIDLDNNDNRVVTAREVISELTGSEGKIGDSTNWETLEFGTGSVKLSDGLTVGLLNSDGEIDSEKCDALSKFPYSALRSELDVGEQLRIEVRTLVPNESVCLWGGDPSGSTVSVSSERYLLYNDGTNTLPAVLTVTVYSGQPAASDIYLTEVMYNPSNSGANFEWVEVYNPNDAAIYINKWIIGDLVEKDSITANDDETITIPAKTAGILTASPTVFRNTYGDYSYVFSVEDTSIGNGLDDADNLTLTKGSFTDRFSYTTADGANGNGKTLTRSCYNCEDWAEATESAGTV
tara:strand:- start:2560 stop:3612 length:1053 start_codon:yes stop_codon:yes gene_type:complete